MDNGHRLGTKPVTAIHHDDSDISKHLSLTTLETELRDFKKELLEILLIAQGAQPKLNPPQASYFHKEKGAQPLKDILVAVNATTTLPRTEHALGTSFDYLIDRGNGTLHFADRHDLETNAVNEAKALLARHPKLRQTCRIESVIVDLFDTIMTAYHR
ncbi:hypothetical protein DFS34DRAFT_596651 [Phlyctochytrium arcticum]|nr:hypothetical protein DFS34DRAFT_596651 [Phlyctochytrium arcticum]